MNIKIKTLVLFLIFSANIVFADVFDYEKNINQIINKLPELNNRTCKFKQEKYIQASNIHLKSQGDFTFEKNKGITFYTTYPIKTTTSYTTKEYKQINNIIKGIADKNYSKLNQEFKFYFVETKENWTLGLKPKENTKIENYVSSIEITGKKDISKIVIITSDKTKTVINFEG